MRKHAGEYLICNRFVTGVDGLSALEKRTEPQQIQVLFSAKPTVAPVLIIARAKGQLDHVLCALVRLVNLVEK